MYIYTYISCTYIYVTPPKTHMLHSNYVHPHLPQTKHSCTSLWNLYFLHCKCLIFQCWQASFPTGRPNFMIWGAQFFEFPKGFGRSFQISRMNLEIFISGHLGLQNLDIWTFRISKIWKSGNSGLKASPIFRMSRFPGFQISWV